MLVEEMGTTLTPNEIRYAREQLGREPNALEWAMIDAEWSEHCSYKSSRALLKQLPSKGPRVLVGPGYDSGVVDIGDGYVLTMHIESHNHPSAIDPYGGAATGIGGVVRDILCMGTTPIALFDSLRFGEIQSSDHSKWIMKNVVRGIADYGNCIGVPTVAGEIEFDESFERNCLVDVACLGLGRKDELLLAEATHPGDNVYLIGGTTGRDGIHGSTFASRTLAANAEEERSAVQIPDPFTKKLIIEATLETSARGLLRGCKDLGGGGLATGLSEIADKGATGLRVHLERIPIREPDMNPIEIMISESQERMLLVVKEGRENDVEQIMRKYSVLYTGIGNVNSTETITVTRGDEVLADLPTSFLANAPLIERTARVPRATGPSEASHITGDLERLLLGILALPSIASKEWVFRQYDHEVGIRTVVKPGIGDAAVLRLPNGKFAAAKLDGNARVCELDPYVGAASVLAEACRNVVSVGAEPLAFLDHCQFGDPNDEEIFWAFSMTVKGLADFAKFISIPCIGGKVSFYNQDAETGRAIKPSPVIAVLGLIEKPEHITNLALKADGDTIIVAGETRPELGGSEYYHRLGRRGDAAPRLDFELENRTQRAMLECIRRGGMTACHDCSKGGVAVAVAEMAVAGRRGVNVDMRKLPAERMTDDELFFSESNSRFLLTTRDPERTLEYLRSKGIPAAEVGVVRGDALNFRLPTSDLRLELSAVQDAYENSLPRILEPWQN